MPTTTEERAFLLWATGKRSFPNLAPYQGKPPSVRAFYGRGILGRGLIDDPSYRGYGKRLMICPLHGDEKPSMGTFDDRDGLELFKCFGCGKAGTVIDLAYGVQKTNGVRYYPTPAEWVFRACSGNLGIKEYNRFHKWFQTQHNSVYSMPTEEDEELEEFRKRNYERKQEILSGYSEVAEGSYQGEDKRALLQKILMASLYEQEL